MSLTTSEHLAAAATDEQTSSTVEAGRELQPEPESGRGEVSRSARLGLVIGLLLLVLAVGAKPSYHWWHARRTEQYRTACTTATDAKSWERLKRAAGQWVQWDPQCSDGWVFLAEAHVQLSEVQAAADALGRVDDSYHGALQALAARAEMLFSDLNLPYAAEETWQRMLRIDPRASVPRQRLIYFYAMSLQRPKLLEEIHEAIELECEPPEAYAYLLIANHLNFSDGLPLLTQWRTNDPNDETLRVAQAVYAAKQTVERGMATFGLSTVAPGDQSLIDDCLRRYPSNLEVLSLHIERAVFEGNRDRVAALLGQSPVVAEDDSRFWRYRGWLLAAQGRHLDAEKSLRKALQLYPFDWQTRWILADALRHLGRNVEADEAARVALMGKDLQTKLFERPNARDLDFELVLEIHGYVKQTGPPHIATALEHRL